MSHRDLKEVLVLAGQLGYPSTLEEVEKRFCSIQDSADHGLFVALTDTNKITGFIHVDVKRGLLSNSVTEIAALIVDVEFRNLGIGKLLTAAAEQWARDKGFIQIRVKSQTARESAHRFYSNLSYARVKTSHVFIKQL